MSKISSTIAVFALLSASALAPAQTSRATITGAVKDSTGASLPNAVVVVTEINQHTNHSTQTNGSGIFIIPALDPGLYDIEVTAPGFRPEVHHGIALQVAQTARQDFSLAIGSAVSTVQVTGSEVPLTTDDSVVGQVIPNHEIVDLPLNGRNYLQLALLTTGVAPANGSRVQAQGGFSALGQHGSQMLVVLDGIYNSSTSSGGQLGYQAQIVAPSVDAVQEFKVVTNNNSAEYGYRMGGTVLVSTKSGTNSFHGTAFEFLRNDKLDAVNYFASSQTKPPYRQNEFGGTIGGPIFRERTFFFLSYDGTRNRQSTPTISTIPTAAMLRGDFTGQPLIYDPATTATNTKGKTVRTAFTNNQIPSGRIDPIAAELATLFPSPNLSGAANNYYFASPITQRPNEVDARLDQTFSSRYRGYIRYSRNWTNNTTGGPLPLPADGSAWTTLAVHANSAVANLNTVLSPRTYNDFSLGYSNLETLLGIPYSQNLNDQYGIKGLQNFGSYNQTGLAAIVLTNFSSLGSKTSNPNRNNLNIVQASEKIFTVRGHHTLSAGVSIVGEQVYRQTAKNARGQLTFTGAYTQDPTNRTTTGNAIADFLLGDVQKLQLSNTAGETSTSINYAAFVQDNWRVLDRLTLNAGLRWDIFGSPSFGHSPVNRFTFTPGAQTYQISYPSGTRDCGCDRNWLNFAPRLGFAYQAHSTTVIHGGFGLVFAEPDGVGNSIGRFSNQAPNYDAISLTGDKAKAPAGTFAAGFPAVDFTSTSVPSSVSVSIADSYIPTQYVEQWYGDVQQKFGPNSVFTLAYLGSRTRHLIISADMNQPLPASGTLANNRPRPFFTSITKASPVGNASYNSLTAKIERRMANNLTILGSYTWSHAIDNTVENLNNSDGQDIQNNYDLKAERGNSIFDLRHYFVFSTAYDLPFGRGHLRLNKGWTDIVLGGWQLAGIASLYNGTPFTPYLSTDVANTGTTNRPNRIKAGTLPSDQRNIQHWFDVSAFPAQTEYTFGNSGRNILTGPSTKNIDLKLGKQFAVTERTKLDFRAEFYNALNTPNFNNPNAVVDSSAAATITSAKSARQIQFGLKLIF